MSFFYSDNSAQFTGNVPLSRLNKNAQWRKHLDNLMFLEFVSKNTKDFREKMQAEKEIPIARRKMAFWAKFHDFDDEQAKRDTAEVRKMWSEKTRGVKLK